ncbi:hypothetical protein ScPMuIL_018115 [Solemya velum]
MKYITGVATKGLNGGSQWVTRFQIIHSLHGHNWTTVKDQQGNAMIFAGNVDSDTLVINTLPSAIKAMFVRIKPIQWYLDISLRFDLIGCAAADNTDCSDMLVEGISNDKITASSYHSATFTPDAVRLSPAKGGSWAALYLNTNQYIQNGACTLTTFQVDFNTMKYVTGIATKGRFQVNQWVTQYYVLHSANGIDWHMVKDSDAMYKSFSGNEDHDTLVVNSMPTVLVARFIRINPTAWHMHMSMRFDVIGCDGPPDACNSTPCINGGSCIPCWHCDLKYKCACGYGFYGNHYKKDMSQCHDMLVEEIPDYKITASSQYDSHLTTDRARLSVVNEYPGPYGSWAASTNNIYQWIQVDFNTMKYVTGIATKGRFQVNQWVTQYYVLHSANGIDWHMVKDSDAMYKIFPGNSDTDTLVENALPYTVAARFVRINPVSYFNHISMRFDVIGCDGQDEVSRTSHDSSDDDITPLTAKEYLDVDANEETGKKLTDDDILALVDPTSQAEKTEQPDEQEPIVIAPDPKMARSSLDGLLLHYENIGDAKGID